MQTISHDDAPTLDTPGGNTTSSLATPSLGARELLVIRQRQEPGGTNPMHSKSTEAVVVVLDGTPTIVTETGETTLAAGDTAIVPAGELHRIRNGGDKAARWIVASPANTRFTSADGEEVEPAWAE